MRDITVREFIAELEKIENKDAKLLYFNEDDRGWSSEITVGEIYDRENPSEILALGVFGGSDLDLDIDLPPRRNRGFKEVL